MTEANKEALPRQGQAGNWWSRTSSRRSIVWGAAAALLTKVMTACSPQAEAQPIKKQQTSPELVIISPEVYQQATEEEKQMLEEHIRLSREFQDNFINPNILGQYEPVYNMIHPNELRVWRTMRQQSNNFTPSHTTVIGFTNKFRMIFQTTFTGGERVAEEVMFSFNNGFGQFPQFPGLDQIFRDEYRKQRTKPYEEADMKIIVDSIFNLEKLNPKKQLDWKGVVERGSQEPSLIATGTTPEGRKYELKIAPALERFSNDRFATLKIA